MTNTKFRKRALLSSVAMLLVALVALGSATFAWFEATNHADAQTIGANTAKSSNIVVSETNNGNDWTHALTFALGTTAGTEGGKQLVPVTTTDFSDWKTGTAAVYDKGYSTNVASQSGAISNGAYVKHTELFVKSTTEQAVQVTPSFTNSGVTSRDKQILRVAFVPKATGFTNNYDKPIIWATLVSGGLDDRAASGWTAASQTAADPKFVSTTTAGKTVATLSDWGAVNLGTFSEDQVMGFDVYVWVEGTDLQCIDSNSGTTAAIKFDFDPAT